MSIKFEDLSVQMQQALLEFKVYGAIVSFEISHNTNKALYRRGMIDDVFRPRPTEVGKAITPEPSAQWIAEEQRKQTARHSDAKRKAEMYTEHMHKAAMHLSKLAGLTDKGSVT